MAVALLCLLPTGIATAAEPRPRSPLADAKELEKPITVTETKIPLGELVQKVAAGTGVKLIALPEVADEPVAVVVKELPARELLEQLAELLDYRWSRRGKEGEWRYEIWQDVAGRQQEEALRQAVFAAIEKRFRQEVQQHIEMAKLSQEQIQALVDADAQHRKRIEKLPPEQRRELLSSPGEADRSRRAQIARALSSPINRSLARLLGRLSPEQWKAILREGKDVVYATDPGAGELRLPAEVIHVLSTTRPVSFPPVEVMFPDDPQMEALRHQREKEMQDRWVAAGAYRVILRMNSWLSAPLGSTGGMYSLRAEASARIRNPAGSSYMPAGPGATLLISARPLDLLLEQQAEDRRARRRAEGEKDPVLSEKKPFRPEAKPQPASDATGRRERRSLRDLFPDLARTFDVQFISDAYWNSSPILDDSAFLAGPTSLAALLDRSAWYTHEWDRRGRLIRLRSRTWFFDRPREVPLRLVHRWKGIIDQHSELPLEEHVAMATTLNEGQWATMRQIIRDIGLPDSYTSGRSPRPALRLYAILTPAQRQALRQGRPLLVSEMTREQQERFRQAVRQQAQILATTLTLDQWQTGRLSLTTGRFVRVRERQGGAARYHDQQSLVAAASRPPAREGAPTAPSANGKASVTTHHPITRVAFHFACGPELNDTVDLMVSSPP
jgi:hypothetical protein